MMYSSDYLVDPMDLLENVFFAAGAKGQARVVCETGAFVGMIVSPEDGGIEIRTTDPELPVTPGAAVCVDYEGPRETFRFYSQVLSLWPRVIQVATPSVIERTERRVCPRVLVRSIDQAYFVVQTPNGPQHLEILNLCQGGFAFRGRVGWATPPGLLMNGTLDLGLATALRVGVEVRHAADTAEGPVIGAALLHIALKDRCKVATFLRGLILHEILCQDRA